MEEKRCEQNLGYMIRKIHNDIGKYFSSCWDKEGIEPTRMQCATMHYLEQHSNGDVFQKDLEKEFSISGATATKMLKIMEKDGILSRVSVPTDARLKKLELTEKGYKLSQSAKENVIRFESGMKKGFTEEELTIFRGYLDRMAQNIVDLVEENTK